MLGLVLVLTLVLIRSRSAMPDALSTRHPSACVGGAGALRNRRTVCQDG